MGDGQKREEKCFWNEFGVWCKQYEKRCEYLCSDNKHDPSKRPNCYTSSDEDEQPKTPETSEARTPEKDLSAVV